MKVGFAGLGYLGSAIVTHLRAEGLNLLLWNRNRSRAEQFDAAIADSPRHLIEECDVVFVCLFDSDAVDAVLNGADGLLSADCAGKTIIDTTTNHFERVLEFHEQVATRGAHYLEAPVLGSVVPATTGKLVVVASGEESVYAASRPLLELVGDHVFYLPEPGSATRFKLINNMLLGAFMSAIAEALFLAEQAGIETQAAIEIFSLGGGKSGVMAAKQQRLVERDYTPHFKAELIHKDLGYLEELASSLGAKSELGAAARKLYDELMNDSDRFKDFCAVYEAIRRLNGR